MKHLVILTLQNYNYDKNVFRIILKNIYMLISSLEKAQIRIDISSDPIKLSN